MAGLGGVHEQGGGSGRRQGGGDLARDMPRFAQARADDAPLRGEQNLDSLLKGGAELSRALGASKSSMFAILQTLLGYGFVADSGSGMSRRYRLGMALARLGDVVVSQIALRDVAMAVMRELVKNKYSRLIMPEHPRSMENDKGQKNGGYTGWVYNVGYARAMLQVALMEQGK